MGKVKFLETHTSYDSDTGEVKNLETTQVIFLPAEPPYVKLYIAEISRLHDLQSSAAKVLQELACGSGFDGKFAIGKRIKEQIALNIGSKLQTVENSINQLVKSGLIMRIGRAEYEINPDLFAKGDWRSIKNRRNSYKERLKDIEMSFKIKVSSSGKRTVSGSIKT